MNKSTDKKVQTTTHQHLPPHETDQTYQGEAEEAPFAAASPQVAPSVDNEAARVFPVPPTSCPPPELPEGWMVGMSGNIPYFYNSETGESKWWSSPPTIKVNHNHSQYVNRFHDGPGSIHSGGSRVRLSTRIENEVYKVTGEVDGEEKAMKEINIFAFSEVSFAEKMNRAKQEAAVHSHLSSTSRFIVAYRSCIVMVKARPPVLEIMSTVDEDVLLEEGVEALQIEGEAPQSRPMPNTMTSPLEQRQSSSSSRPMGSCSSPSEKSVASSGRSSLSTSDTFQSPSERRLHGGSRSSSSSSKMTSASGDSPSSSHSTSDTSRSPSAASNSTEATSNLEHVPYKATVLITMELCNEGDLAEYVKKLRGIPVTKRELLKTTLILVREAMHGVDAIHKAGFIHRDLKPKNIFVHRLKDGTVEPRIGDFGFCIKSDTEEALGVHESEKAGPGTSGYASLEQKDLKQIGPSADVYSMGISLLELVYLENGLGMETDKALRFIEAEETCTHFVGWMNRLGWFCGHHNLYNLVRAMLNNDPSNRPTSSSIISQLDSLVQKCEAEDE